MIDIAAAVEDDRGNPALLRPFSDQSADGFRRLDIAARLTPTLFSTVEAEQRVTPFSSSMTCA